MTGGEYFVDGFVTFPATHASLQLNLILFSQTRLVNGL